MWLQSNFDGAENVLRGSVGLVIIKYKRSSIEKVSLAALLSVQDYHASSVGVYSHELRDVLGLESEIYKQQNSISPTS